MPRIKAAPRSNVEVRKQKPTTKAVSRQASFFTETKWTVVLCILLAVGTIALYWPVLGHSFIINYDDEDYVTANAHVQSGLSWNTVKWAFTSTFASNWHPLTWLSHALDCQLFGLDPWGHHLDNLLLHAASVVLLFLLLVWMTKRIGPSAFAAALYAVHPLNVETVSWVAERKNVLSNFFLFATIAAYVWYARRPGWRRYLLVVALFAAGLMAKPMVITLPFVLLLLDYWPLNRAAGLTTAAETPQRRVSALLLEKLPLLALSAASAWITLKAQRPAVRTLDEFPLAVRVANSIVAYSLYLWKMVWPVHLSVFYPHVAGLLPLWRVVLSAVFLLAVTALVVIYRRKGYLPVGWFWFLGTLVPVIGLVQVGNAAMADRYAYLPLIGIFMLIAWGLDDLARTREVPAKWRGIAAVCVVAILGILSFKQMSYWQTDYTLWAHAVRANEQNALARAYLADALANPNVPITELELTSFEAGPSRLAEAHRQHEEALKIYRTLAQQQTRTYQPHVAMALFDMGDVDRNQNHLDEARQHYEEALTIYRPLAQQNPDLYLLLVTNILNNLGFLDERQNLPEQQRRHYEEALQLDRQFAAQNPAKYQPFLQAVLYNLGNLDRRQGRPADARRHYEESLQIQRQLSQADAAAHSVDLAKTLFALGDLDGEENRIDDASRNFNEALTIYRQLAQENPAVYQRYEAETLMAVGEVARLQNRLPDSRAAYVEALSLYRSLAQRDPGRYGAAVGQIQAALAELQNAPTQ